MWACPVPYRGVAVRGDPHARKVVGVDLVLYELAPPLLVHVDAPGLAVVDLAAHHRGVGVRLHLEARDAVPVDVTALKVALGGEAGGAGCKTLLKTLCVCVCVCARARECVCVPCHGRK